MAEMVSAFINISESLSFLEEQEKEFECSLDGSWLKDHTSSLRLGLQFLQKLLRFSNNEDVKLRVKLLVYNTRWELYALSNRPRKSHMVMEKSSDEGSILDYVYTNLGEKMKNVIYPKTGKPNVLLNFFNWPRDVRTANDFLLEIYRDVSAYKGDQITPSLRKKQLLVQALLTYVQALLTHVAGQRAFFSEETEILLTPILALFDKALFCLYSLLVGKTVEELSLAKDGFSDLLETNWVKEIYIVVLRASKAFEPIDDLLKGEFYLLDHLINLLDSDASAVTYPTDLYEKLNNKLKFLKTFLSDLPQDVVVEKYNYLSKSIEGITCTAIPIIYSCDYKDMKENMAREVNAALSEIMDQIENIQAEVREIKLYAYPTADVLGFLDLLLGHLGKMLKCRPELINALKNQIEIMHAEFDFLRSSLRKFEQHHLREELRDLRSHIIALAYEAEYCIDIYLVKSAPHTSILLSLSNVIEKTKLINLDVTRIYYERYHTQAHSVLKSSIHFSSKSTHIATDEVVGFEDEAEKIMEYLVGEPKQLDVVSIVGMPGLGKTTLAKKFYESPSLVEHFHVRAWCCVSQTYQRRELLLSILGDVIAEKLDKLNDEELAAKLYQSLKGRRYLIVIDDMWDIKAWNDLVRSLPDDKNYSRILITSRLQNVASWTKAGSKVHPLRLFSEDESWELFQKKVFQKESFSSEFFEVGKQIAQSCKKLPLVIVVISGLLAKVERSVHKWKQIAESLISHILSDSESHCKVILELSYSHLPDHLRSCFLYFGAFLEDKEIPVCKLKWLWIAEGFIQNTEGKSLEDVAEEYFMDLISRSLIIGTKVRSLGGVKACRIHDVLHHFCLEKAKEENFLQVIHVDHWSKFSRVYDHHQLSIYSKVYTFVKASRSVRSILFTGADVFTSYGDVSFISRNFKLLRVLDLADTNIGDSFSGMELLIHLRYVAVTAETTSIPLSMANLWNLQFFLVKNTYYFKEVVDVPDSLWDMVNLRHVHIYHRATFNVHSSRLENSYLLDNLETLSRPLFSCKEDAENLLRRLPTLRKLECVFIMDCWNDSTNCYHFPQMDFLGQLTSLKVFSEGRRHWEKKCEFKFPLNLQKLTLSNFRLSWNELSEIVRTLPNLKVLKLIGNISDITWIVNDGDFPKLKYLKLKGLVFLRNWIASEDCFPNLKQLVLDDCWYRNDRWGLTEIPPCFGEIPTLQRIVVKDCKPSVDDSARRILKEQQEVLQNEDLHVYIHPRNKIINRVEDDSCRLPERGKKERRKKRKRERQEERIRITPFGCIGSECTQACPGGVLDVLFLMVA